MSTESPPVSRVATMVLFTLSCVGLLLFLWLSFGGTMPFNAEGYRFTVALPNAFDVADQADVRIAGVNVGKVVGKELDAKDNRTLVTVQMQNQYAPIRKDTKAILRQKTVLGETYLELSPGPPRGPPLPDGGRLANGQVVQSVQLDQIFNTFDPTTRDAFHTWQQEAAKAVTGNDQNLNFALGNLPTFAVNFDQVLQVLDVEHNSVVSLVRNGGTTFAALNRDPAALRNLITAGNTTFGTLARNQAQLAATIHTFPEFLTQSRLTMAALKPFSLNADPVIRDLIPAAQKLKPTLAAVNQLSPYLRTLFTKLGPLITVSAQGLPATQRTLRGLGPHALLAQVGPFLEQLNPIIDWISQHQQLTSDFISDGGPGFFGRTNVFGGSGTGHYLRQFGPTGPETLSLASNRDSNNRGNTYPTPLWLGKIFPSGGKDWGLQAWDCRNTGGDHPSNATSQQQSCYTQPKYPAAPTQYKVPPINKARYSTK